MQAVAQRPVSLWAVAGCGTAPCLSVGGCVLVAGCWTRRWRSRMFGCIPSHGSHVLQVVSATITVTLRARVLRFYFDGLSGAVRIAGNYAIPPACCCCCFAMARCCSLHASCPLPCVPCVPACVLNPGAPVCHPHRKQTDAACGRSLLMWRPGSASWCTAAGGNESGRGVWAGAGHAWAAAALCLAST